MRAKRSLPGLLAIALVSIFAMSGAVGASSALACLMTPIEGEGSSLQKIAQQNVWGLLANSGCSVTYTASGSAAGLEAFGAKTKTLVKLDEYIGTDDAPNAAQLVEMEEAASGVVGKKQDLVIPVAQAAIAVIVKPPTGCTISQIGNVDLQKIWAATITEWNQIATASGGSACKHPIVRVVRQDGSGTTYQFKHYLFEINKGAVRGTETWEDLQPETVQNLKWPEEPTVVRPAAKGGGEEVKKVNSTENSIGYANLGDAEEGGATWLEVQNNGEEEGERAEYKSPSAGEGKANCGETSYGAFPETIEPDQDWSKVYGGHPIAVQYPICTLTWDVGLMNYEQAGYSKAGEVGMAAMEYLEYITSLAGGQSAINSNHGYLALTTKVREVAEKLAKLVSLP